MSILVLIEDPNVCATITGLLRFRGHQVDYAAQEGHELIVSDFRPDLRFFCAQAPVMVVDRDATLARVASALKDGAFDVVEWPPDAALFDAKVARALSRRGCALDVSLDVGRPVGPSFASLLPRIKKAARSSACVHVHGESGTGKEVVAKAVHDHSARRAGPFITVNCGAIPESLLESELFGHAKGAFTGAVKGRKGKFEQANGGTIFLDEVGELPLAAQVKLLRVIQERVVEPVGADAPVTLDLRVVSATNRALKDEVAANRFRSDLFYRLHVIELELLPLRARREDILPLARAFLAEQVEYTGFDVEAERLLMAYDYPGNVRELQNIIVAAAAMGTPPVVTRSAFPPSLQSTLNVETAFARALSLNEAVQDFERGLILHALKASDGVKSEMARRLKLRPAELISRARRLGVDLP